MPPNIEADENWFTLTFTRPSAGEESVETREKFGKKLGKGLGIKLGKDKKQVEDALLSRLSQVFSEQTPASNPQVPRKL